VSGKNAIISAQKYIFPTLNSEQVRFEGLLLMLLLNTLMKGAKVIIMRIMMVLFISVKSK
jgi:hypothetical protein